MPSPMRSCVRSCAGMNARWRSGAAPRHECVTTAFCEKGRGRARGFWVGPGCRCGRCPNARKAPWFALDLRENERPDRSADQRGATSDGKTRPHCPVRTYALTSYIRERREYIIMNLFLLLQFMRLHLFFCGFSEAGMQSAIYLKRNFSNF